jgi:AraC-like DNA-binding protein
VSGSSLEGLRKVTAPQATASESLAVHGAAARSAGSATHDGEHTLSIRFVQRLVAAIDPARVPKRELMRALGIDAAQLEDSEARVQGSQLHKMLEIAIDLSADPALGLHCATGMTESGFAPLSYLISHAANLRHAFETLASFERLLIDRSGFELLEQGDRATVRMVPWTRNSPRVQRFAAEMAMTSFMLMLRHFDGHARPERVCFDYAEPPHRAEYARIFAGTERFEQAFTGLVFDRALLDRPSPRRDADVHAALRALAERRVMRLSQCPSYALRVREFLLQQGRLHRADMTLVARALGVSARSLRRHLAAEGASYKAIENKALAKLAKQLLRDPQRTIKETAREMGFSDATTFHRAFKRWTGTTPTAYRART